MRCFVHPVSHSIKVRVPNLAARFAHDFSKVRIHTDAQAADSARALNAIAYTSGQHVVFEAGAYNPGTRAGLRLLAHELTHTIQQSAARSSSPDALVQRTPNDAKTQTQQTPAAPKLPWYQQQQLEAIEGRIQDWTEDEKNIARSLLRKWIDLQNKRVEKAMIASQIQEELLSRYYKPWLQAEDQVIQDYCHKHDLGPRERFGGGISCEPLFTGDRQLGENELASMRSYMKVTGPGEDEAPLNVVHQWVREYRNRTNPEKLKEAGLIQSVLGLLSLFATPGGEPISPPSRPAVETPAIGGAGEGEIKVGDVHSIPGIGARRVIAVMPNGDVVYESGPTTGGAADPSVKPAPPAQKQLPPGPKPPDTKQITSAPPSTQKQVAPTPKPPMPKQLPAAPTQKPSAPGTAKGGGQRRYVSPPAGAKKSEPGQLALKPGADEIERRTQRINAIANKEVIVRVQANIRVSGDPVLAGLKSEKFEKFDERRSIGGTSAQQSCHKYRIRKARRRRRVPISNQPVSSYSLT